MLNTTNPHNYTFTTVHLHINILGGIKLNNLERMRVTLAIQKITDQKTEQHNVLRHNVDLYNDTMVEKLVRKTSERIEIGTSIVRKSLQELTSALETYRIEQIDKENQDNTPYIKKLSSKEEKEAIKFLQQKGLIQNTNTLIGKSGVIGEITNRLLMYLIFTSRKMNNPLHCISLGSSGVGKTHLQSKVAELIPNEDKIEITVLSANAFYYFNRTELKNKLILIEDLDGAESVLYPLRELQSKKKITKTVVHKDRKGTTKTIHLTVEGPVSVAGCTTQESVYEDNSNRSFLLYIDESPEQDKRIMHYQRLIAAGKIDTDIEQAHARFLRNVQRMLQPIKVINPFAIYLYLPSAVFKPRRTNTHYLQLIAAITFYYQHQRTKKYDEQTGEEYIETTIEDIKIANTLITEVLLRKSDPLTGAARNYLERLKAYLLQNKTSSFTNSEIRKNLRIKESTLRGYHKNLLEEGYIKRVKKVKSKSYCFKIIDINEYQTLKEQIDTTLQKCIAKINVCGGSPPANSRPTRNPTTREINTIKNK